MFRHADSSGATQENSLGGNIAWNLRYLRARPGGRLLDVGCGDGAYLVLMRELRANYSTDAALGIGALAANSEMA